MAITEATRPRLWVQGTVVGTWYSVLGKTQNQPQQQAWRAL